MRFRIGRHCCEVEFCRGAKGKCSLSLLREPAAHDRLTALLHRCASIEPTPEDVADPLSHKKLKIAFAACPNACTTPQIKDVGFITELSPQAALQTCNQCGQCAAVCREQAITIAGGPPQFDRTRCVACGMCIRQCPQEAIQPAPLQFAVLIGGRMGRHPRFADRLCTVGDRNLSRLIGKLLTAIEIHLKPPARFADMIEHIGLSTTKEQILYGTRSKNHP